MPRALKMAAMGVEDLCHEVGSFLSRCFDSLTRTVQGTRYKE